jgi:hypothetical protein
MKKTSKKTDLSKRFFGRSGKNYIKGQKNSRAAKLVTAVIIFAAVLTAIIGIMTADRNSREVGWNDKRTELAFAVTTDRLYITVVGQKYYIDTGAVTWTENVCSHVGKGFDCLRPSPLRLMDMLYIYASDWVKAFYGGDNQKRDVPAQTQ